jgi:hypothetical protein
MTKQRKAVDNRARGPSDQLKRRFDRAAHRAADLVVSRYPRALGVVVNGSVGRGEPLPYSDVDILAVTKGGRTPGWFSYFDDGIHIAVGFVTLRGFRAPIGNRREFFWIRGGARSAKVLYDPQGILDRVIQQKRMAKATPHVVETIAWHAYRDIIEYVGKLRNGWLLGDEYLTRYAARIVAERAQEVVLALNDISPPSENAVWHQVIKARKRPTHFSLDYPISLGVKGKTSIRRVFMSALRLAMETVDLIKREFSGNAKNKRFLALMNVSLEDSGFG